MKSSLLSGNSLLCSAATFVLFVENYTLSINQIHRKELQSISLEFLFFLSLLAGPSLQDQATL